MKKLALALVVAGTVLLPLSAAVADPPPGGPPGQGECEHGNSGQECKPDPQPEHGKDCEEHGPNEGGVNEDHCLSTTTQPPTTTAPPATTSTVTTTSAVPTITTSTASTPPSVTGTATTAPPITTTAPTTTPTEGPDTTRTRPPGGTAFTGLDDVVPLAAAALFLLVLGSGLFWLSNRKVR